MDREKKIIVLAHCILNQNSVVNSLARAKGGYNRIIQSILERNIGILQLPCPELLYLGLTRQPMTSEQYDQPAYHKLGKNLLEPVVEQLLIYQRAGYKIVGYVGIDESPSCSLTGGGHYMNQFKRLLAQNNLDLSSIAVPTSYHEEQNTKFTSIFTDWLDSNL